jgi:hypothetical protein
MAVTIVRVAVTIIVMPLFATVIMMALRAIRLCGLLGFLDVGVAVCYLYQLTDGCRPLAVEFSPELLVLEPLGECDDSLTIADVGDGVPSLREAPDKTM